MNGSSSFGILSIGFLTALLLGLGCRGASRAPVRVEVRDSAGVEVVLNTGSITEVPATWTVSSEPTLAIGSVEGDEAYQFLGIAGAHRLSDGRLGVVNAGSREVRFYGPGGRHLVTMGRKGGGPEEFEAPALAGFIGDTLIIVDRAHHRLTFVHPDEGFVGLARVSDDVGGFLNPVGSLAGGRSVFGGAFDMRRIGELHNGMNRAHTYYRSCNPDGSPAADFGDKAGAEFFIRDLEAGGQDSRPAQVPVGKMPVATASSSYLYFSDQDKWEIEVHAADGTLVRVIRQAWEPIPVEQEDVARYFEEMAAGVGDPEQALRMREYLSRLPVPDHFPPFDDLLADRLGYLWVEDYSRPGTEASTWTVFDPEGVRTARLTLPPRFNPIEIGADYVLGVGWDALEVEYVRMYALERPLDG
jgi:hypothetical protein